MAIARNENQILWGAANSEILDTANSWALESDVNTQSATAVNATIQLKANQTTGTPASGDIVTFYGKYSLGDPDGAGSDEYTTDEHDAVLAVFDLNSENPGQSAANITVPIKGLKIRAVGEGFATTDEVTISATILELTA